VDHDRWLLRPLPHTYLTYAYTDVALIHALYNKFVRLCYITPALISQSELYITMWKHHQPASHERHLRHPLLPLGMLNPSDASSLTMSCTVCSRELASTAFPALGRNFMAERKCWVCRAVAAKNNNKRRWEDELEELEEYLQSIEEQDWDDDYSPDLDCWDDDYPNDDYPSDLDYS
jgi:hypothetical protein